LTLSALKDVAIIAATVVALGTWIMAVIQYRKQRAQKRAEQIEKLRIRFKSDPMFRRICELLGTDDVQLREIPLKDKHEFLGSFEEIALMVKSGLMEKRVAHYMFGYHAIRCWKSNNFWSNVNRNSAYWALFRDFAEQMSAFEEFVNQPQRWK
jgi:hypothetical protein